MPDEIDIIKKRLDQLEKENKLFKEIFQSAKPLKCVFKTGSPFGWNRHYHTEEEFLSRQLKFGFEPDNQDDNIGYLLKLNPNILIKKD